MRFLSAAAVVALVAACSHGSKTPSAGPVAATLMRHIVVIFHGNISFDHYFGTYY
ncbi:hypothetical protein [Mycobacterium lepromatosis]|uniref:hypothetical protein n=1 Tax=Mycobacterium lepromatosis TaxID=480418 RepID=UPI000AF26614|nr:hypothetical protein [Mycobacterium lepromatosis]